MESASPNLSIFVPGKVWTANQANKDHHFQRAKKRKEIRSLALLLWRPVVRTWMKDHPGGLSLPVEVIGLPYVSRQIDPDAGMPHLKACLDGLVDSELLADDSPEYVRKVCLLACQKVPAGQVGMLVTVVPDAAG